MMWLLILAWVVLLGAAAIAAQQTLGFNVDEAPRLFVALPLPQQVMIGVVAALVLILIVVSIWQAARSAQRNRLLKSLQMNVDGIRSETALADEVQRNFDAASEHLGKNDPVEAIASLQKRIADAEQRAAVQQGRNESVDLRERLEDIRQRQHTLRKRIGEVSDRRRTIEPVFGELKERQAQLEEQLAEIETDDNKNSLAGRMKSVSNGVAQIQARLKALEDSWEELHRFKEDFGKSQTQLIRLQAPEGGLAAMIDGLHTSRDRLTRTLDEIESHGGEKVAARVEALSRSKVETEQRVAGLDACFMVLNAIRREFGELEERRSHLERALGEVETDAAGRSLADRQNELNEFAARTRVRVRVLQDCSTALNGFRQDFDKSQAALVPLQSQVDGIEALIGDVGQRRDRLINALDEIELNGDEKLAARMEAIYRSKVETEQRLAQVVEQFAKLDSMRKEIDGLFARISSTIEKQG